MMTLLDLPPELLARIGWFLYMPGWSHSRIMPQRQLRTTVTLIRASDLESYAYTRLALAINSSRRLKQQNTMLAEVAHWKLSPTSDMYNIGLDGSFDFLDLLMNNDLAPYITSVSMHNVEPSHQHEPSLPTSYKLRQVENALRRTTHIRKHDAMYEYLLRGVAEGTHTDGSGNITEALSWQIWVIIL